MQAVGECLAAELTAGTQCHALAKAYLCASHFPECSVACGGKVGSNPAAPATPFQILYKDIRRTSDSTR